MYFQRNACLHSCTPRAISISFAYKLAILSATHLEYLRVCVCTSIGWRRYALHLAKQIHRHRNATCMLPSFQTLNRSRNAMRLHSIQLKLAYLFSNLIIFCEQYANKSTASDVPYCVACVCVANWTSQFICINCETRTKTNKSHLSTNRFSQLNTQ